MEIIRNIAVAIDNLRISKGLTVRELCLDICDESSYRRYRLGDREIPIARIKQFCDKLGIGLDEFLYNLASKNSYEHRKVYRLFYDLTSKNYEQIKKLLPLIDIDEMSLDHIKVLYEYILYTYQYQTQKITKPKYHSLLSGLLPEREGFYTFNDIIILEKLSQIELETKETKALEKLQVILLDTSKLYSVSDNYSVIATVYANVANVLTRLEDFDNALIICQKGIDYSITYNATKNIHYIYYLQAYCFYQQNNQEDAMKNLSIVISIVYSMQDKRRFNYFIELIMKEFNMTKPMVFQMYQLSVQDLLK